MIAGLVLATAAGSTPAWAAESDISACSVAGTWLDPDTVDPYGRPDLFAELAKRPVVLLGENHPDAEHHRWQLHTMAALHALAPRLVLGFEMFPRRVQPALDAWVRGELDEAAFLEQAEWSTVWGYDPELYLPLFRFARQNRIPMVALNVERALVTRVGDEGWAAIPEEAREGVSDPAPVTAAYREVLAEVYAAKLAHGVVPGDEADDDGAEDAAETKPDLEAIMADEDFKRFVEAQVTWDRAMAEALAEARRSMPDALVVGVIGQGHLRYGHGVPHQLADLGLADSAVLLPVDADAACETVVENMAMAVFVVPDAKPAGSAAPKPRLGVMIEGADEGVLIVSVLDGSVAGASGLAEGDLVTSAAGFPVARTADLIEIVQRQSPGTWLPMTVRRDGEALDVVAKFPTAFDPVE